jgi:hypothetical protein
VVLVPEAERLVADLRLRYDSAAALGVLAHVTVLYPFVSPVDEVTSDRVDRICRRHRPFTAELAAVDRFPGLVVWLRPRAVGTVRRADRRPRRPSSPTFRPTAGPSLNRFRTSPSRAGSTRRRQRRCRPNSKPGCRCPAPSTNSPCSSRTPADDGPSNAPGRWANASPHADAPGPASGRPPNGSCVAPCRRRCPSSRMASSPGTGNRPAASPSP